MEDWTKLKVRYKGNLVTKSDPVSGSIYYLDQLWSEWDEWVWSGKIYRYLNESYGLTTQQYYNLIMGFDVNYQHKCENPNCNELTLFTKLSKGYNRFCSRSCTAYETHRLHPEIIKSLKDPNSKVRIANRDKIKEMFANGSHPLIGTEAHAYSRYSQFLNQGNETDLAWFYLAKLDDKSQFKFGITAEDPGKYLTNRNWYRSIYPIIKSTRIKVAQIEYDIKIHFDTREEYFEINRFKEVMLYIIYLAKYYNLTISSTTISKESTS